MLRNTDYLSNRHLLKSIKSILALLICVIALHSPTYGQCNAGPFINEFHYDNVGADMNEFVEVAVPLLSPIDLTEYVVSLYNGADGMVYDSQILDNFQMGNTDANYTYYVWKPASIQQGPDGIALSRVSGLQIQNCEFLSYEGTFGAVNGPAMGNISVDVGVAESGTTPDFYSLQLINGTWVGPIPSTPGNTNMAMSGVLLISELEICDQLVEIQNVGLTNVDISTYMLCNFPNYAMVSATNLISGSLMLGPGDFVTVQWNGISMTAGEVGLYIPGTAGQMFGNPDNIIDYVQYNSINNTRALVAVMADVWDDAAMGISAGCLTTAIANGSNPMATNSTTWCDALMPTIAPAGTNSGCVPPAICGVSFPNPANLVCQTFTAGLDGVDVSLEYVGVDAGAVLEVTVNGSVVINGGDNPASVANGTIKFSAQEGDTYVISFTDATCMSVSSSGTISTNLCPAPVICPNVGDLIITEIMYNPSGSEPASEWFEVCNITNAAIDMNGMDIADNSGSHTISASVIVPAGACIVLSHTDMLVCGGAASAYQHGAFSLNQAGDKVEISCGGVVIDVVIYDGGSLGGTFPSEQNGESISFNSAVSQDHITNDSGANWCVGTIACGPDDRATPGVANPACLQAICGITSLGSPSYICTTSTAGLDVVKVNVPYVGMDPGAVLVITVNMGIVPNVGDNPATVANGTISFMATEGDIIELTFTDALCGLLSTGQITIPPTTCPGPTLCGVSFPNPADLTCQTSTAGIDNVGVSLTYLGIDPGAVLVITVNGLIVTNFGDNPATVANGTILFPAQEGDSYLITFTDPACSAVSSSGMIPLTQCPGPSLCSASLFIAGVIDGDLGGGRPKAMQLCATADIADLSFYGIESVDAGAGAMGIEYNFPPDPLDGGECIWLSIEEPGFVSFFGFAPCYTDAVMNVDGDDALILYCGNQIMDVLGDPNCDPNAFPPMSVGDCGNWEYMDGWVFAMDAVPNPIFNESEWDYSMEDALDGEFNNATATRPYPNPDSACPICPDDFANGGLAQSKMPLTFLLDTNADLEADGDIISDQVIGSLDPDITVDYDSGTSILLNSNFEVFPGVTFHAFIDGCGGI